MFHFDDLPSDKRTSENTLFSLFLNIRLLLVLVPYTICCDNHSLNLSVNTIMLVQIELTQINITLITKVN